jgi:exodeoxyribonuclease-1
MDVQKFGILKYRTRRCEGFGNLQSMCDDSVMAESMYWYDYETTGIDAARDRVLQFAGVRTDMELNVISEPLDIFCKPADDVIPSPDAILVTKIKMSEVMNKGLTETAFIERILAEFSVPGTCVAGFNSLRFDDEFTRNALYRNFLDPYAREWQGGNSRWDVIDLFRMAQALRPDGFVWPSNEQGDPTFRLEKLTAANGIGHESAHDAVSDVLATIDVTRKLRAAQPKLFDFLFESRNKKRVTAQLYPLGKQPIIHVSSMYPAARNCIAIILPICVHPTNPNGVICFDLTEKPDALIDTGPDELHRLMFSRNEELQEGETRMPLKTIHINRCPAIAPVSTIKGQQQRLGLDLELCMAHLRQLQTASGIVEKIQDAVSLGTFENHEDPDLMLYQGDFFSSSDKQVMAEIRQSSPQDLASFQGHFQDSRLPEMLFRFRARNFPTLLKEAELAAWDDYRKSLWQGKAAKNAVFTRISELEAAGRAEPCLDDLKAYVTALTSWL